MEKLIYILTKAETKDEAEHHTQLFLETEDEPYCDGAIQCGNIKPLKDAIEEITAAHSGFDSVALAEKFIRQAETEKTKGDFALTGHYYRKAAVLYEGSLTADCAVYNIVSFDYSIPFDYEGWFAVLVKVWL